MLKHDIQSQDDVVFDNMDKHIIMAHVGIVGFHSVAVFFGQSIVFEKGLCLLISYIFGQLPRLSINI